MLLEFKARNYKSFKDELCLSMMADTDETALNYSLMEEEAVKDHPVLCSTVVYGSNASGKTNVISALDTFRAIVLRGNIDNAEDSSESKANPASALLELIPNNANKTPQPVKFSVRFLSDGALIYYAFSADLGDFCQQDYNRKILSESLSVNGTSIFTRTDSIEAKADSLKNVSKFFKEGIADNLETIRTLPGWDVEPRQLFLCNGFSSLLSPALYKLITGWLSERLKTICRSDKISVIMDTDKVATIMGIDQRRRDVMLMSDERVNDALSCIGAHNGVGYIYDPQQKRTRLASVTQNVVIPAEAFESYGTYRFANLFPLLAGAFEVGSTLVLDEFDASLHPMVLMNIISLFHNPEINRNHAQLIFNTHNPIFLDRSLFRRDEIKFVERDEETQSSKIYALSDFEPERDCEDYLGNYFRDRYGAIQYVDLTPVFRKVMGLDGDGDEESGEA